MWEGGEEVEKCGRWLGGCQGRERESGDCCAGGDGCALGEVREKTNLDEDDR